MYPGQPRRCQEACNNAERDVSVSRHGYHVDGQLEPKESDDGFHHQIESDAGGRAGTQALEHGGLVSVDREFLCSAQDN